MAHMVLVAATLLALKAGEIKRRSRFHCSPSEKKTPCTMPLAACSKEPHKETLGNGQNYSDLFSFSRLEAKLQKSLKR